MSAQRVALSALEVGDRFRIPRRTTVLTVRKIEQIGTHLLLAGDDEHGRFAYHHAAASSRVELAGPCRRDIRTALAKLSTELERNLPALLAAADEVLDREEES